MKIYLAAQFKEQDLMMQWAIFLRHHNHFITSRWLVVEEQYDPAKSIQASEMDLSDVDASECVISHTLNRGDLYTGGGRHIEFGYALAKGKKLINVGGHENVFHHLAITVPSIEDVLKYL